MEFVFVLLFVYMYMMIQKDRRSVNFLQNSIFASGTDVFKDL
jgi:hypothetical protein